MAEVKMRRFGEGDSLEELTALLHRAYAELAAMGFNYTASYQDAAVTARRIEGAECWLAVAGGAVAGTVTLTLRPNESLPMESTAFIHQFAVDLPYRSKGIGRLLLDHAESRAAQLGFRSVGLDTAEGAVHLVRMYGARGYREVGRRQWEGKTYESVVMVKDLADRIGP